MSLFAGLFSSSSKGAPASNLFSDVNEFKSSPGQKLAADHDAPGQAAPAVNPSKAKGKPAGRGDHAPPQEPVKADKPPSKKQKKQKEDTDAPDARAEQAPALAAQQGSKAVKGKDGKKQKQQEKHKKTVKEVSEEPEESEDGAEDQPPPQHITQTERKRKAQQADSSDDEDETKAAASDSKQPKRTPEEEAERLSRTLFVGNVPATMTRKALTKVFSQQGWKLESVRLRSVPLDLKAGMPRKAAVMQGKVDAERAPAVAYAVFATKADAEAALSFNMTEVQGHHLQINWAVAPSKQAGTGAQSDNAEYDPKKTLFCGNLHFLTTNEELIQFFTSEAALDGNPELNPSTHGGKIAVEAVRVVRDAATNIGKGFAFILFRTKNTKKKGHKGRKEKVTAEMKRAARKQREEKRALKAASERKEREEIFEVGDEGMSLEQLADIIQVDPSEIVRSLFMKGIMLSMNQVLDKSTCKVVAAEYDLLVVDKEAEGPARKRTEFVTEEDIDDLMPRPPVVTVMGHVDHGKTSLLDFIRKSRVAAGEAGGITQGIGAYNTSVEVDGEKKTICFLDTPGHEAFSAMRARGAQVTDIAIIIVAADDGVRPQTREAVAHAQAAEVPILVAINKVDKPGADVERAKQQLLELNLVPEEWGGSTPMVAVSAKKGTGIDDLLQMVCWMAEEKQYMVSPKKPAQGTVIEAHLDKKIGPVATLLVQAGTLKPGDLVSAGGSYGKVRTLRDDLGRSIDQAGPSIAVQMIGLDSCPVAGEEWHVAASEQAAREAAETSLMKMKQQRMLEMTGGGSMVTLSSLATMDEDQEVLQKLNLIIKGDTVGVVEAIKSALGTLPQQSITLRYLLSAAGDITTSDVDLAAASGGLVVGFNLTPDVVVEEHAKRQGVKVMTYKVIYDLIDDIKAAMEGKLRNVDERIDLGTAEVKALFGTGKKKVAGCTVKTGKLQKGTQVMVKRAKKVVFEGKLNSLRRVKDLVDEVKEGADCGVGCDDFLDWAVGDIIECFQMVPKVRRLEDARAATAVDISSIA